MKTRRKTIMMAVLLAVGTMVLLGYGHAGPAAQPYPPNPPTCCLAVAATINDGAATTSAGTMQMEVVEDIVVPGEPVSQMMRPVSFNASGDDPQFGQLVWELDDTRTLEETPLTVIRANQPDELFPATCDIYFYVRATASAFPGVTFRSRTPVHMRSVNLQTFSPHMGENYELVEPVEFMNDDGEYAFTATSILSTLT